MGVTKPVIWKWQAFFFKKKEKKIPQLFSLPENMCRKTQHLQKGKSIP